MTAQQINKWGLVLFALFTLAAPLILPLFIDAFWVDIYSEMLIWSLLAASVNLL
ncbi:MAG TPA: branched-chain amino acid ABC transporter permease, partial [Rhodospirillaceae bacterium]|nr:branched-chain amino acid ABC transporter permease [Rhodospirillaceae bacterium]